MAFLHARDGCEQVMRQPIRIFLLSVFFLMLVVMSGLAGPPADMARILKARRLVVSMHQKDAPPFFMTDKAGRLYGLEIELAYDLARKLGVEVHFQRQAKTYDDVVRKVEQHEADVAISLLSRTSKRAVSVSLSDAYVVLHHALLVNRRKTEQIARGKKPAEWLNATTVALGAVKGSAYVEFAQRDYPAAQVVQYASFEAAAEAVLKGEIHAVLYDDSTVQNWVLEHPADMLHVQMTVRQDREDPIAMAVNSEDVHLLQWINIYLDTAKKDGTLDKLVAVYLKSGDWKDPAGE